MSTVSTEDDRLHVLVIAHPDDESMFFVPTIRCLKAAGKSVWIICLTTGDYDGLGRIRAKEIVKAGKLLGVDKTIVRDTLKDHPTERWQTNDVVSEIEESLRQGMDGDGRKWRSIILISFDRYGVSGHLNHVDTHNGVSSIGQKGTVTPTKSGEEIAVSTWLLISERNLVAKYFPLACWVLLFWGHIKSRISGSSVCNQAQVVTRNHQKIQCRLLEPTLNWRAMRTHASQFVWYRRLFVVFSCYTYVNCLEILTAGAATLQARSTAPREESNGD